MRVRVKNKKNKPVIIAPVTLVVTKVKPKRIAEKRIVNKMERSSPDKALHTQRAESVKFTKADTIRIMGRYTTPIPNATQKKAVPIVNTPVILRNAVTMPIISAAAKERAEQGIERSQLQFNVVIISPPVTFYVEKGER